MASPYLDIFTWLYLSTFILYLSSIISTISWHVYKAIYIYRDIYKIYTSTIYRLHSLVIIIFEIYTLSTIYTYMYYIYYMVDIVLYIFYLFYIKDIYIYQINISLSCINNRERSTSLLYIFILYRCIVVMCTYFYYIQ